MADERYEVIVIGGGPAGLSAALYLARYDRQVALFDVGRGRSTWHQINYNYLGFPGGVAAVRLRELGRQQLADYSQVTFYDHKIEHLIREPEGFCAEGQAGDWHARTVILCTGVIDHYPHFEGWEEYVGRSMFWCITCDGYGCKGARVVVSGNSNMAASEALQLQRFISRLTVLTDSHECNVSDTFRERLERAGIPLICDRIERVSGKDGQLDCLYTQSGLQIECEQLFSQRGATPQTQLAEEVGVALSKHGYVQIDSEQKTNVSGFYAAGDITRLHSHQVSAAVHEGGQAASAANYYLYPAELKDE